MGYTVHVILQVTILEWVAFPFSRDLPNPGIKPRCPALILYQLNHKGSPSILEWVAYPFSKGSHGHSQTRRQMKKGIVGLLVLNGGDEPRARESGQGEASSAPLADDSGRASQSSA